MQNLEILGIVNTYMAQKEAAAKARQEGITVPEVRLPAAVAWKRRINMDKLFQAKRVIDEALREIGGKYSDDVHSTEKEDGSREVKAEFLPDFLKEQSDILTQDTEVDIRKVKISELDGLELTDADMDILAFMIEEDE